MGLWLLFVVSSSFISTAPSLCNLYRHHIANRLSCETTQTLGYSQTSQLYRLQCHHTHKLQAHTIVKWSLVVMLLDISFLKRQLSAQELDTSPSFSSYIDIEIPPETSQQIEYAYPQPAITITTTATIPEMHLAHQLVKRWAKTTTITTTGTTPTSSSSTGTETGDDLVTVYTQVSNSASKYWSINVIVPTITTNKLPTGYSGVSNYASSSQYNCSSYYSGYNSYSRGSSSYNSYSRSSSQRLSSSSQIVPTYNDLPSSSFSSSKLTTSSHLLTSSMSYYSSIPTTSTTSTTTSISSTTSLKSTTTVTEYLDAITYTQVYVITDSKYTLTTSLLATTTILVDSLSSTYSISPPAITTDINALRSRADFSSIFQDKLSKGSIAGIAVGSIVGFLFIVGFILFYFLRRRKSSINIFSNFIPKSKNRGIFTRNTFAHDNTNDTDDDDDDDDYDDSRSVSPIDPEIPPHNLASPPIPSRSHKPLPPMIPIITTDLGSNKSPALNNEHLFPQTPVNSPNLNDYGIHKRNSSISSTGSAEDDLDMSLFDMKSTLNAINASTEVNHHLMPPVPPARKSLSSNRIDKMNYRVDSITPSPSQLPIDRTMGVLYESPNEQPVWDEFEGAKSHGFMAASNSNSNVNSNLGSPIDSVFGPFDDTTYSSPAKNYKSHYMEQFNANGDYEERPSLLDSTRVRSGSGAKRYEHLANNVNIIKHELEKERLASPLSMNFKDTPNDIFSSPLAKKEPPPIPKPRKNFNNNNLL